MRTWPSISNTARRWWLAFPSLAAVLGVCLMATFMVGILSWSTNSADRLSRERQQRLVAGELDKSRAKIAYDQESVTIWDESITQLTRRPLDEDWLDNNLGIWLHDYYGHDAAYVLADDNAPLYAMEAGRRGSPADFSQVAATVLPLVEELRTRSGHEPQAPQSIGELSSGVAELLVLEGRPAIVSTKLIISDTGEIVQAPGEEFAHVSVRYIDGSFTGAISEAYGLERPRFSWTPTMRAEESSQALRARDGSVVGYFTWRPFAPGSMVYGRIAPILLVVFALLAAAACWMMRRIVSRTRELHESNATVQHLAFHDPLTGLPNRALFEDRLEHALAIIRRTGGRKAALLFIDLDRFKLINDSLGHAAGDEMLKEFADRLRRSARASDTVARLGGDEFAIIQEEVTSPGEIEALCQRIVAEASRPFQLGGSEAHTGTSIGVAMTGKDGLDMAELARKADIALYESKARGRGQYQFFSPALEEPIRQRLNLERDLRVAIEAGDQFMVVYQPVYSAATRAIAGVEALIRWHHPEAGLLAPSVFIPIAEECGLIEQLGEWVMIRACTEALDWPIQTLSINISPVQLRKPHFAARVIAIITEIGIDPGRIELEITETAMLEEPHRCSVNLRLLKRFGLRIALDDFGMGYSSFRHFTEFEVDRVKIDRSFVGKIATGQGGRAIIQAMVDLARSSGFRTTAEGVETSEQMSFLQQIGCDELQGFFLAAPIAAAELHALFENVTRLPHPATAASLSPSDLPARTVHK